VVTQAQVKRLVTKWSKLLCVSDWTITVVCEETRTIQEDELDAVLDCDVPHMCARLVIATDRSLVDVETTVVEEIVHIVLSQLSRLGESAGDQLGSQVAAVLGVELLVAEEQAANRIVRALLRVRSKK